MAVTIGHALLATCILPLRMYGMSARVKVLSVILFYFIFFVLSIYSQTLFFLASGNKDRNSKVSEGLLKKNRKLNHDLDRHYTGLN